MAVLVSILGVACTAAAADAETNWNKQCASCHGKDGSGETRMGKLAGAKDYRDPKVQAAMKDDEAFKSIKDGMKVDDEEKMKPYGDSLTDDEIKELIALVRSFEKKELAPE